MALWVRLTLVLPEVLQDLTMGLPSAASSAALDRDSFTAAFVSVTAILLALAVSNSPLLSRRRMKSTESNLDTTSVWSRTTAFGPRDSIRASDSLSSEPCSVWILMVCRMVAVVAAMDCTETLSCSSIHRRILCCSRESSALVSVLRYDFSVPSSSTMDAADG